MSAIIRAQKVSRPKEIPQVLALDLGFLKNYKRCMDTKGKVVVITGASMGIGEAIAKEFLDCGANVVFSSRDLQRAEAARQRVGSTDRSVAVACDVTKASDLETLLSKTLARFQRIDVWVNNAGYGLMDSVESMDMSACRRMFDTNVFGTLDAMQLVIPLMRKQASGTIINIASTAGHIAVPFMAAYCATKHALRAIGNATRIELRGTGVNVLTVCPGYISTDFSVNAVKGKQPLRLAAAAKRGISADRVARAVVRGYVGRKREISVPWRDHILIKLYEIFPTMVDAVMARMLAPADQVMAEANSGRKS
jgi:short-subunit dehydrogenase